MLLKGLNHVAVITNDASRLQDFYREVFEAEVLQDGSEFPDGGRGPRLSIIKIGDWAELNVFEIEGNSEADRQTPMFGRGRLDHLALQAASLEDFEDDPRAAHGPRRRRRLRHRLRAHAQPVLPGSRRPGVRGLRREPRRGARRLPPAREPGRRATPERRGSHGRG